MFKAIEVNATSRQRTGRAFVLEGETRQAAIDALLVQLQVTPEAAIVDPSRTMVRIGEQLWTLISAAATATEESASASLRRAGAKHKRVR
jgi:hypothetical protein